MITDERLSTYIESLSWNIPDYLKKVEKSAVTQGVPIIRRQMQSLLCFILKASKPHSILEIGTAVGFSSMLMSECISKEATIDTIEKVPARIEAAKENFKRFGLEERINLFEGDALDVLTSLADMGRRYDFVFMDAAKGQYMNFLEVVLKMLDNGGILITDNVLQDGDVMQSRYAVVRRNRTIHGRMRKYLHYLTHSDNLDTIILPVGDGAAVSIYKRV